MENPLVAQQQQLMDSLWDVKKVCTAYVVNKEFGISADFLNRGTYELDIAGKRFPVRVNLHSPSLPMISSEHPLHYRPTQ
ncbi:hypothetical protein ANCCEY_02445 [Ancylostoma ceylanicum]|nr:hypothetical protein ANCCEY_02445 [Ancylostoma ceylanicum]